MATVARIGFGEKAGMAQFISAADAALVGPAFHYISYGTQLAVADAHEQDIFVGFGFVGEHPAGGEGVHVIFEGDGHGIAQTAS